MIPTYISRPALPRARGFDFGAANAEGISATASRYTALFEAAAGQPVELEPLGDRALVAIGSWAPDCAREIEGIAEGAGLPRGIVAALNARTEVLAYLGAQTRGECSTIVSLGEAPAPVVAGQTWDWHEELEGCWLVWTIEHPSGRLVHTLTEYGLLGKLGVNSARLGVLLNILHHRRDGRSIGVPVHVVARRILDEAADLSEAAALATSARVSASSAITLVGSAGGERSAVTAELYPGGPGFVLPDERGVLLHTNHFISEPAAWEDLEPVVGPDSFVRYDVLRRRFAGSPPESLLDALCSHLGGAGALCAHPDPDAPLGARYATLATVLLDVEHGCMTAYRGGPCRTGAGTRAGESEPLTLTMEGAR